jgi:serine phosphatase RsbU (regulator of sigma subunit)
MEDDNPVLLFAASPGVNDAQARWLEPVLRAWPGPTPPTIQHTTPAELTCHLDVSSVSLEPEHPTLVVLGPHDDLPETARLAELLRQSLAPALIITPKADVARAFSQRDGVLIQSDTTSPESAAAMLFALLERQPAVVTLARELHLAQLHTGGLRGELESLQDELHLAAAVQRDFLPSDLPALRGVEFGVMFRPTSAVSGDIYDVKQLNDHTIGFFLADAVGHGVPAALLTMVLTKGLVTLNNDTGTPVPIEPCDVLARLNRELCQHRGGQHRFATALYGVLDTRTMRITIAGAGHPPPLRLSRWFSERVMTEGPLLGVFEEAPFNQASWIMQPGELLLLHTDGFEVCFPDASAEERRMLRKPTRRYLEHLTRLAGDRHPEQPLSQFMERVSELLNEQAGSLHQADDITLLAIANTSAARATIAPTPADVVPLAA